ncbi:hypothetical protein BDQ17DRAFT_1333056 [Cyathus striatus]|nr:hypothetical protein BDQ17DRAFT_1333056 [Cyathus striatus]
MTIVIGQAFDAFAQFPLTSPSEQDKHNLLRGVGIAALELVGLAVGSMSLGSLTSWLWIWTAEVNVASLGRRVYRGVMARDMEWFDTHLGVNDDAEDPLGAAGLMAKFNRIFPSHRHTPPTPNNNPNMPNLALTRSWSPTLIILSSVPLLALLQGVSQSLASPLFASERSSTGIAATLISRAKTAIATVKAFNAQPHGFHLASSSFFSLDSAARKLNLVWAVTSGSAQFVMMAMFVQAFWFGTKLVRDDKASAGDVMAVFWACLIATSNSQMSVPQLIIVTKGKLAMVELLSLIPENTTQAAPRATSINEPITLRTTTAFSSPSKPRTPRSAGRVAVSSSGRNVIYRGFLREREEYDRTVDFGDVWSQEGSVCLDGRDLRHLDESFLRKHVGGVGGTTGGGVVLDGKNIYENVLLGVSGSGRPLDSVSREVEDACKAALVHEFVRDLPHGYDTVLGESWGVSLSGGQRQRLEISRARLWNQDILIFDEATPALDTTSRILVFEAIKHWRRGKTTIVITHDLSMIEKGDFVYVMKSGCVVEQGYRRDLEAPPSSLGGSLERDKGEFRKMLASQMRTGGFVPKEMAEEAALAFFETVVKLFQTLPTFTWLLNAGITPLSSKTFTLSQLTSALKSASGVTPSLDCSSGALNQISWYFNLKGSIIDGTFVAIDAPESGSCPSSGNKYPPKSGSGSSPTERANVATTVYRILHQGYALHPLSQSFTILRRLEASLLEQQSTQSTPD